MTGVTFGEVEVKNPIICTRPTGVDVAGGAPDSPETIAGGADVGDGARVITVIATVAVGGNRAARAIVRTSLALVKCYTIK